MGRLPTDIPRQSRVASIMARWKQIEGSGSSTIRQHNEIRWVCERTPVCYGCCLPGLAITSMTATGTPWMRLFPLSPLHQKPESVKPPPDSSAGTNESSQPSNGAAHRDTTDPVVLQAQWDRWLPPWTTDSRRGTGCTSTEQLACLIGCRAFWTTKSPLLLRRSGWLAPSIHFLPTDGFSPAQSLLGRRVPANSRP